MVASRSTSSPNSVRTMPAWPTARTGTARGSRGLPPGVRAMGVRLARRAGADPGRAVLAGCIRSHADVETALRRYEQVRLPPTSAIVEANRGLGPERPMQLVEERAPRVRPHRRRGHPFGDRRDHRGLPAHRRICPRTPRRSDVARRPHLLTAGSVVTSRPRRRASTDGSGRGSGACPWLSGSP